MFSLQDANIHNLAIEGVFDDCQDIVKAVSNDLEFKRRRRSAPSTRSTGRAWWPRSSTTSPATSGPPSTTARQLRRALGQLRQHLRRPRGAHDGAADRPLVVATNENDVLDEFFRTGTYRVRGAGDYETSSPRWTSARPATSSASCSTCWAATRHEASCSATAGARPAVRPQPGVRRRRFGFVSGAARMPTAWDHPRHGRGGRVIDTHTADGLKVAREHASGPARAR